jgi:hypothetical protein
MSNLPSEVTSFVGRRHETTLALPTAARAREPFPDGV